MRRLAAAAAGVLLMSLLALAGPGAMAAGCTSSGQPTVTTNKSDYQPGDTVVMSGSGFACDAALTVSVTPPSGVVTTIAVTSDSSGAFTADYPIPAPDADPSGLYAVRVLDATGAVVASTTFVDTHFRYMTVSWTRSGTNPNQVTFNIESAWRSDFPWPSGPVTHVGQVVGTGYAFQFGDGSYAEVVLTVVSVSPQDWFVGTATLTHTYAGSGPYLASFYSCCRLSTILENNHDQPFRITTEVTPGELSQSPRSSIAPIQYCPSSGVCSFQIPVVNLESGATPVYSFSPSSMSGLPTSVPSSPSGSASLSPTGTFTWNTTGAQAGLYATQVQIGEKDSIGSPLPAYIVDDFLIEVVNGQLPTWVSPTPANGSSLTAYMGQPLSFSVAAKTPNAGATVDVTPVVLPAGAQLNCPTAAATTSCTFTWTATAAEAGATILNFNAEDSLNLNAQPLTLTVNVESDTTPPVASAAVTPAPNANGWNNSAVSVNLSAVDPSPAGQAPASGVASITYTVDNGAPVTVAGASAGVPVSGDGTHTVTYYATDNAGNRSAPQTQTVKIDTVAPTLSGAPTTSPNAAGWYNSDVTIHWTYGDNPGGSGIDPSTAPGDSTISAEGRGLTAAASVSDLAGNTTTATSTPAVNIDKTPPTITIQGVQNGATYTLGAVPAPSYTAADALSGVATSSATLQKPTTASGAGTYTYTVTATDKAGNTATVVAAYQVVYQWGGFLGPVTNGATVDPNRTIPIQFTLLDANGNVVTDAVATLEVDGHPAVPQGSANSGDQFAFHGNHDQYQLKLRDQGVTSGTVTLTVKLDDGTTETLTLDVK